MLRKLLVTAAIAASLTAPAFAATTYYVGKDSKTNKCSVSTTKPTAMIGTAGYSTKAAAETAMKAAADCK